MAKEKKMGRPPAPWARKILELPNDRDWIETYELAEALSLNVRTVKSFFQRIEAKPQHEIKEGKARAKFKVGDLKKAVKAYLAAWS